MQRAALADAQVERAALDRVLLDVAGFTLEDCFSGLTPECPECGAAMDSAGGCAVERRDGTTVVMPAVWVCDICSIQVDQ